MAQGRQVRRAYNEGVFALPGPMIPTRLSTTVSAGVSGGDLTAQGPVARRRHAGRLSGRSASADYPRVHAGHCENLSVGNCPGVAAAGGHLPSSARSHGEATGSGREQAEAMPVSFIGLLEVNPRVGVLAIYAFCILTC